MRARLTGNYTRGVSTLEILIAFAVFTLSISAVIMVVFGNQSVAADTQTNIEAISKAQKMLEDARAQSRLDFNLVNPFTTTETSGPRSMTSKLDVIDLTQCKKQVISTVTWNNSSRPQKIEFSTFLSDIIGSIALGRDCLSDPPYGDWSKPKQNTQIDLGKATGIDVIYKTAFLTLSNTTPSRPDLAIIDVTSSTSPILISSTNILNSPGFNAIDVATSTNGRLYAYIAKNDASKQLQIIDVSNLTNPVLIASSTLPNMATGIPRSIFYHSGRVYIGTQYLACVGCSIDRNNELHIFDVTDPTSPQWEGSINVNRNVNAIAVRNNLAYLATGSGSAGVRNPFKIFDVAPLSPTYKQQVGLFTAAGDEDGTSLYLLGNKIYLSLQRAASSRPDFFILDVSNVSSIIVSASRNLNLSSNAQVNGIRVAGGLAFLGISDPNDGLQIRDISKSTIDRINTGSFKIQQNISGIDMNNNTVYLSAGSGSTNFIIVGPMP
ncbi:MAG: hypothetical protein DDT19_01425 [Syntrophomonadaceae bacterium]|nr:hypothetical protein [Bacillota bacterium]